MFKVRATVGGFYGGSVSTKWTDGVALQERCRKTTTRRREPSKVGRATEEPEDPEVIGNLDLVEDLRWNRESRTATMTVFLENDTKLSLNEDHKLISLDTGFPHLRAWIL